VAEVIKPDSSNPSPSGKNQQQQVPIAGMSMDQLYELIRALRAPSDEELKKKEEEAERKKEWARQAKLSAEAELNQRTSIQQACIHRNEKRHTFVAQVTGNGDAVALCQICRKDYKWRATPDQLRQGNQLRQGINLFEYAGLNEQHLLDWEKRFPPVGEPPDRIKLLTRAGKTA
jgi:hypothetical protein